jgi:AraC-like DNA-binding protein
MSFLPQMQTRTEGFSVLRNSHRRYWDGMVVDLWDVDCAADAGGYYMGPHPRLFAVLEARRRPEGNFVMAEPGGGPLVDACYRRSVSFIPAGLELRTEMSGIKFLQHLDLHFEIEGLTRRFGGDLPLERLEEPRFIVQDQRLLALADLIAAECASVDPLHHLYGDGLTLALLIDVLKIAPPVERSRSRLAPWQLRKVTEFMEHNCLRAIRLEELAAIAGLSQSHFSHAFKASTGVPPHQWQLRARMDRVKSLLVKRDMSLTTVAAETGFSDPAHFARTFRRHTGLSPSAWRKAYAA